MKGSETSWTTVDGDGDGDQKVIVFLESIFFCIGATICTCQRLQCSGIPFFSSFLFAQKKMHLSDEHTFI